MDKVIVYTYGAFDLLHPGHLNLLRNARELGDCLVVGVLDDIAIRERKGKNRPIQNQVDRIEIVNSLKFVDMVIPQKSYNPYYSMCELPRVDILTKGDDWGFCEKVAKEYGCKFTAINYSDAYSTTGLIKKIKCS